MEEQESWHRGGLKPISPSDQDAWSLVVICRHRHHGSISEKFRQGVDALGHFFAAQFLTVYGAGRREMPAAGHCVVQDSLFSEDNFCHPRLKAGNYRVGPGRTRADWGRLGGWRRSSSVNSRAPPGDWTSFGS